MSNKMLIDASHPEETRVVVTHGNRIEEFDFESEHKKQLKGNIYLARITRVEPSLQAAFVEYGGNRHGFLAFSEIHPDYYQIPVADRLALLEAEAQAAEQENENNDSPAQEPAGGKKSRRRGSRAKAAQAEDETVTEELETIAEDGDEQEDRYPDSDADPEEPVEIAGLEDVLEEVPTQRPVRRDYKIQEVIKRRQVVLVQVTKEERGNKGAALTTYLSLAGRYSVLMPNTARGGGISRKITNVSDRKRLRDVVKELEVPKGMGVILRTAGASRTKAEVKRDYEYLIRLWENVRDLTLNSTAPALVYEEGDLIKRSIRDLYNKDISEILVAGEKGYREAKDFMRMLMPSHAKTVQPYRDKLPIFARNGIESQLDRMSQPEAALKSGGYIVINQTEALVSIDVNSGRATKEHSIEETAAQTNLEAAEEIARQLRLRDLAGLVVIDFIDMQDKRNIRMVEKKLKDCLKEDRARIQVGRISHFGLMEMSRQRLRASVLESTTQPCPHCSGTGYIRSESSVALHVIRSIEDYLLRNSQHNIIVRTPVNTALYVLNHKRKVLGELENRFGLNIDIEADDSVGTQHLAIYKGSVVEHKPEDDIPSLPAMDIVPDEDDNTDDVQPATEENTRQGREGRNGEEERKRRRRRGRRGGRRNRENDNSGQQPQAEPVGALAETVAAQPVQNDRRKASHPNAEPVAFNKETPAGKRNKGKEKAAIPAAEAVSGPGEKPEAEKAPAAKRGRRKTAAKDTAEDIRTEAEPVTVSQDKPAKPKRTRRKKADTEEPAAPETAEATATEAKPAKKAAARRTKKATAPVTEAAAETVKGETPAETTTNPQADAVLTSSDEENTSKKTKRMGWWQRKGFF
ncbi:MAG: Ribonuclease E [Candidatus Tokpelaia hoelldobleri]|uniref:Ribonuclease E n=1 Tax=Candidatus Tokpelaia hoelldobleri TaxID=1902579 RepID=A0A1U9JUT4_9HYPH|nr:MAG: Ribonuclease E [Candidatus Tokpelaia hoelldoblerii]